MRQRHKHHPPGRKGFMLAAALLLVPICLMLTFSLVRLIITGSGFGLQAQHKLKAFHVAEAGLTMGFHVFGLGNYTLVTHNPDGSIAEDSDEPVLRWPTEFELSRDSDGWVGWHYDPTSDPADRSFTQSGLEESYRFRVWFPDPAKPLEWQLDCEAVVGQRVATHHLAGLLENPQEHLVFDNGDLADLARSSYQNLEGSIHANGNLYVAPWKTLGFKVGGQYLVPPSAGPTGGNFTELNLSNATVTTGEDIIRRHDYWGRPAEGVSVAINGVSLGSGPSDYFDSLSPQWDSATSQGALAKFGGKVKTRDVGAKQKNVPHSQIFEPGAYYDQKADLHLDATTSSNSWLSKVDTFNEAEKQRVRVSEIDIAKLHLSGDWPENGMLYASTPIRIKNGANLPSPLTIVCSETVYLQGDFNKKYNSASDLNNNTRHDKPAAIMTADRIYRLSDEFQDHTSTEYQFPLTDPDLYVHDYNETGYKLRPATDGSKFPGDPANVIEHNVVLVDSTPTEDSAAFAFAERGHPSAYVPALQIRMTQDPVSGEQEFVFPSSEDFLENMSGIRFEHSGSEIHLRNATMVTGSNQGMFNEEYWSAPNVSRLREGSGPTPYVLRSTYIPPSAFWHTGPSNETPGIFRSHNDKATGLAGELLPFALRSARRTFWSAE